MPKSMRCSSCVGAEIPEGRGGKKGGAAGFVAVDALSRRERDRSGESGAAQATQQLAIALGRGRRDIENLTQAANVDIPVIGFGGSNGLAPEPASFLAFGLSVGTRAAVTCDGTARVVDAVVPNPAFPTFGGVGGGYEVH